MPDTVQTSPDVATIKVKLPDGSTKEVPKGTTALDIAKSISPRLADAALAAKTNGDLIDLARPLEKDTDLRLLTEKDPEEMIRYFGAKRIWKIHFRNVSAPLPHFVETFMDNGYYDMWKIMKALRDVNFDGIVILDHSPTMVGGNYAQTAYGFAYMKALLNRANAEAKG